jgi:hypothetical protein
MEGEQWNYDEVEWNYDKVEGGLLEHHEYLKASQWNKT